MRNSKHVSKYGSCARPRVEVYEDSLTTRRSSQREHSGARPHCSNGRCNCTSYSVDPGQKWTRHRDTSFSASQKLSYGSDNRRLDGNGRYDKMHHAFPDAANGILGVSKLDPREEDVRKSDKCKVDHKTCTKSCVRPRIDSIFCKPVPGPQESKMCTELNRAHHRNSSGRQIPLSHPMRPSEEEVAARNLQRHRRIMTHVSRSSSTTSSSSAESQSACERVSRPNRKTQKLKSPNEDPGRVVASSETGDILQIEVDGHAHVRIKGDRRETPEALDVASPKHVDRRQMESTRSREDESGKRRKAKTGNAKEMTRTVRAAVRMMMRTLS